MIKRLMELDELTWSKFEGIATAAAFVAVVVAIIATVIVTRGI